MRVGYEMITNIQDAYTYSLELVIITSYLASEISEIIHVHVVLINFDHRYSFLNLLTIF